MASKQTKTTSKAPGGIRQPKVACIKPMFIFKKTVILSFFGQGSREISYSIFLNFEVDPFGFQNFLKSHSLPKV